MSRMPTPALFAAALAATHAFAPHLSTAGEASAPPPLAVIGKIAPAFTLPDTDGAQVSLASFAGKVVVLEWFNPGCPYVKYAHGEGPLKAMAAQYQAKDVAWIAINSGAPGKQGHGIALNAAARKEWKMEHAVLLDETGEIGRMYGAKTTPHLYVIDAKGVLAYAGALDGAPLGKPQEGASPTNCVEALDAVLSGKPVGTPETKPYGCSVKYPQ